MTDDTPPSTTGPDADGGSTRRRREAIRRQVTDEGFVRIRDLAAAHGVSTMTIHRDLDELQSTGWLRKVRGGATAEPSASYHGDVRHRRQAMAAEKRALAGAAAGLVGAGATVMIDESTTALELAGLLPGRGPVTVITNFLAAVNALTGESGVDLIALGGAYYPAYDAFLGLRTSEAIRSLRADLLFMSTTAITNGQCYHQSQETVAVKRALMESADRRVLLADHTKFTKNGLFQLAPLTDFDLVIVDAGTPASDVEALRARGVHLHVAGRDGTPSWPLPTER
ncbi:DeoR/GlpR family DNA-binding transcription regulator [Actinomadura oligospora]|uniref:DeoR/GlpR family DNA-binding transcription regulator n=1 Tax=Actinomadura oligospora TaxID=111804 RepID=UPI0004B46D6E|nr:DeoR/GlpR family DNA-binding transcription regulator [Actinomadura oligospora]